MNGVGSTDESGSTDEPDGRRGSDQQPAAGDRWLRVSRGERDRMRPLSWIVLIGLAATIYLAVTGLPETHFPPAPTWQFGIVTPTQGMTRAAVALVTGDPASAWLFNPAVFLVAALVLFTGYRWAARAFTGRWLNVSVRFTRWAWAVLGAGLALLWLNQQLHADLIITN